MVIVHTVKMTYFRLLPRQIGEFSLWLQRIPGDGNCLFGSLVHQIMGIHPEESTFSAAVSQVRASIVVYLRNNFSRYWAYLVPFAEDFVKQDFVDVYDRVWKYLELLAQEGFWGGEDCISVACDLYNVSITVWDERTARIIEYPNKSLSARKIAMYYTGAHYDSVLFFARIDRQKPERSVDIPRAGHGLKVVPFYGQHAIYQSFLHQIGVPPDDSAVSALIAVIGKFSSLTSDSHSGEYMGSNLDYINNVLFYCSSRYCWPI